MRVAVLGAGLQGACTALELARAGVKVDLYERESACLTGASAQNEGKIHLGYVFAKDPTLATARAMARGAVCFMPLLRRWLGDVVDTLPVSSPFTYAVHCDSMLTPDAVECHLRSTHRILLEESGPGSPDYFNADLLQPPARMTAAACRRLYDPAHVTAAFQTPELALDPASLAAVVRTRLEAEPNISTLLRAQVNSATPSRRGVAVHAEVDGYGVTETYDHVVNALWAGRLAVDRTAGVEPPRPWLYRIKYQLRVATPDLDLPSTTLVLGPFGDVAHYRSGAACLSWYPAGMRGASRALIPPDWPVPQGGSARELRRETVAALSAIVPALRELPVAAIDAAEIRGGVIFAWGQTDIDDPDSVLHERYSIGPESHGRYHTVNTGKLTTAPLFGLQVAERILQAS